MKANSGQLVATNENAVNIKHDSHKWSRKEELATAPVWRKSTHSVYTQISSFEGLVREVKGELINKMTWKGRLYISTLMEITLTNFSSVTT